MDWKTSSGGGEVGKNEELTKSGTWGRSSYNYAHACQRYLQTAYDLRCCSWCCDQIFEDRECFLLQMRCMMSVSVEIIFYRTLLIISVWENEPKLKDTTVNHFALRHYWWIEVYTCSEHSESVKQYARIVRASLISSLFNLPGMTAYPTVFLQRFNLLCLAWKIKKKVIFNSCLNLCNFLKLFCFWLLLFHVSWLSSGWK